MASVLHRCVGLLSPLEILVCEQRSHYAGFVTIHYHIGRWGDRNYTAMKQSKLHWPIWPIQQGKKVWGFSDSPRADDTKLVPRSGSLLNRGISGDKYYALDLKKVAFYAALAGTILKVRGAQIPLSHSTTTAIAIASTILSMTGKWGTILGCIPAGFLTGYLGVDLVKQAIQVIRR